MTIGERIKMCRTQQGLTLQEVAEKIGVKEATVQRYESGNIRNLKQETIAALATLFNVSPIYLLGLEKPAEVNDGLKQETIEIFDSLSEEKQKQVLGFLRFLKNGE